MNQSSPGMVDFIDYEPPVREIFYSSRSDGSLLLEWVVRPEFRVWSPGLTEHMINMERNNVLQDEWDCYGVRGSFDYQITIYSNESMVSSDNYTCHIYSESDKDWDIEEEVLKECFGGLKG